MARNKSNFKNNLLFLVVGIIGGFMLSGSCYNRTTVVRSKRTTTITTPRYKVMKRLVTKEERAKHKYCISITKSQAAFEDCVTGENHTL